MSSCPLSPHSLPLEIIRDILESCVQNTINDETPIAVGLQLVSRTIREWLAPLIYSIFVVRLAPIKSEDPNRNAASSSLRGFYSLLQMPTDSPGPRRHVRTLAFELDLYLISSTYGMDCMNLPSIWSLEMVLVPSLAVWAIVSRIARGALQLRVISCAEESFPPFPDFYVSRFISEHYVYNGLKGVSELRVHFGADPAEPNSRLPQRRHEIAIKRMRLRELRIARLHRRETIATGSEQVPPQPARYAMSGRPDSVVLQVSLFEEQDMVQLKDTVGHLLTPDVSGDEMRVVVEVSLTDEPSPYLEGPALLRDLRAALAKQVSDRVTIRATTRSFSTIRSVAEEVRLRRVKLTSVCA